MREIGGDACARRVVHRYIDTFMGEGWADEEAHLRDLLDVVDRTMSSDLNPSRAASWRRLRRAIEYAGYPALGGAGVNVSEHEMNHAGPGDTCTLPWSLARPPVIGETFIFSWGSGEDPSELVSWREWEVITVDEGVEQTGRARVTLKAV